MTDWGAIHVVERARTTCGTSTSTSRSGTDRFHRRVRIGQELARVRDDRGRSQRLINETYTAFVQSFMATPPRPDVDSLENLTRRDHRRPGAHGRQRALDRRHGHRRLRDAPRSSSAGWAAAYRPGERLRFNIPAGTISGEMKLERGSRRVGSARVHDQRRHVRRVRGPRPGVDASTSTHSSTATSRSTRARSPSRASRRLLVSADLRQVGLLRHRQAAARLHRCRVAALPLRRRGEGQDRRHQPHLRRARRQVPRRYLVKDIESLQPHLRAAIERVATFDGLPGVRRHAASTPRPGRRGSPAATSPTCAAMQITDLAVVAPLDDAGRHAVARRAAATSSTIRRHRARLPEPRSRVGRRCRAASRSG